MGTGKKIKQILIDRNMTIKDLSKILGKHSSSVSRMLIKDNLSEADIQEISKALNCSYEIIYTYNDTGKKL